MRGLAAVGALLIAIWCSACRGNEPQTVALFEGGRITLQQVDRTVLATPPAQRPAGDDLLTWLRQLTRQLAVERLLLKEAQAEGMESPLADAELERQVVTEAFLAGLAVEPVSEAELHQAYRERKDDLQQPERRLVRHIFQRLPPDGIPEQARHELLQLRERLLTGTDFSSLAASASHSETRHQGGLLGWVQAGDLDRRLEDVIFALPVGVPSQPTAGPGGFHLIQVDEIRPATAYNFEEVRSHLTAELQAMHQARALHHALGGTDDPASGTIDPRELHGVELRERIYRHCVDRGLHRSTAIERQLEERRERALIDGRRHQRLQELAVAETERLGRFFEDHQHRYSTPLRLRLQRLLVPLADDGTARMALLEDARFPLDRGGETFERLAARLDGEVEALDWQTLPQLQQLPGRAAQLALELSVGAHSAPFLTTGRLEMLRLLEREEPHEQAFEQVRERVLNDYISRHAQRLYAQLSADLLMRADYRELHGRLEALTETGPG